ncbi:hypothetical protein [Reyranella sp.]|uniref:hypothetical protein n=1 Tax=Reyranella sp. TaxID=1929291 RepID=UPI003D0CFA10
MTDSDRKDTSGHLGAEDMTATELLRCLAASLEQMAKGDGAAAVQFAHSEARKLLAKLEPLIAEPANIRSTVEESVRKQPLVALALAAAAGFLLASFRRR